MLDQSLRGKELAPHEFVQTYTVDNQWGLIRGRYSLLGIDMESEAGITPQKTNHASDVDTFFQPDGNVVSSGTTGNASMLSYKFSQRAWLLDVKGTRIGGGYKYQRNRSDFQFGYSFETQTKPPSQIVERLPIPETTSARIHEFDVGFQHRWNLSHAVRFTGEVYVSPAAVRFLSTLLPVKYPGQDIVSSSVSYGVAPRIAVASQAGKVPLEISAHYGRYFTYGQSGFWRELLGFEVRFGWGAGF